MKKAKKRWKKMIVTFLYEYRREESTGAAPATPGPFTGHH